MTDDSFYDYPDNDVDILFNSLAHEIEQEFEEFKTSKTKNLTKIQEKILELDSFLESNKKLLRSRELTLCVNKMKEFHTRYDKIRFKLQKEVFFVSPANIKTSDELKVKDDDLEVLKNFESSINLNDGKIYGVDDGEGRIIENVNNETIKILEVLPALRLCNINNSIIVVGTVKTSVYIEKCRRTKILVACQQLRIRSSYSLDLYVHINGNIVMESSENIRFSEYNLYYSNFLKHLKEANLKAGVNRWNIVDDLNYISTTIPSPNWSLIPDCDLIKDWFSFLKNH